MGVARRHSGPGTHRRPGRGRDLTRVDRAERTTAADALCAKAFGSAGCPNTGVALVAVGGYGRQELAPYSDLDLVLVHDAEVALGEWAGQLWYPLWDSGTNIDHSVRSGTQMLEQATTDLRVALGMLDVRHLAGDPNLTLRLRTAVLTQWRRDARLRLPELHQLVLDRGNRLGELAHASVPDLKESTGGLRDATVLKALVATWLVDVPHAELECSRQALLDVRDALHAVVSRPTDRVAPELWPDIAALLDLPDAAAAQRHARAIGRRITHISRLTWRRAEGAARAPRSAIGGRRPRLEPVAESVAIFDGEVVLTERAWPERDPLLLLRAAAEAAERDLVLAPATAARLVSECPGLPVPWPAEARDLFVRLLAAGPGLLGVWETLEETDALRRILPEWERVRLLPHASAVHRFTVDRHLIETCIEASALIRRVSRPDVLMVAALVHDIGKGELAEHCVAGEPIARQVAARLGFDEREVDLVGDLVRWHLLLPETATTRDPEDPATVEIVCSRLRDREELDLLAVLTEADARATAEKAWTSWRASLVHALVRRSARRLGDTPELPPEHPRSETPIPDRVRNDPSEVAVEVRGTDQGAEVVVVSADRVGLLADAAAMLALQRVSVRAARAWTQDGFGVSHWQVGHDGGGDGGNGQPGDLDAKVLRQRLEGIVQGRVDAAERLGRPRPVRLAPSVAVRPEASARATVLEVRSEDRPGLIYTVCAALAGLDLAVTSAHVATLGPQAVDVFYMQESGGVAPSEKRAAAAAHAVRLALMRTVTPPTSPGQSAG
ncbi:MAG: [protein-PII] uridylyltransferase [Actinomycetota bacterium]|nr:[protein-PII] uridylyltransferase [Actinomycetota bacterium]